MERLYDYLRFFPLLDFFAFFFAIVHLSEKLINADKSEKYLNVVFFRAKYFFQARSRNILI